jgi:hypothetical protein
MRRKTSRAKRRARGVRPVQRPAPRPAADANACVLLATFEIDGKLVHRVVSEIPDDDENLVGISASFAGGQCHEEFLAMVAAYEAAEGQDTPELRAATDAYMLALAGRPCPCGSQRPFAVCCGQ